MGIKNAVIESGAQTIFPASRYKCCDHIGVISTGSHVVVISLGIPKAETRHMHCSEQRVMRSQVVSHVNPLTNVQGRRIVGTGGDFASVMVSPGEIVHDEVMRAPEVQTRKFAQGGSAHGCRSGGRR